MELWRLFFKYSVLALEANKANLLFVDQAKASGLSCDWEQREAPNFKL